MAKSQKTEDPIVPEELLADVKKVVSIYDQCETDTDAEENGRWFKDIFEDGSNMNVKLRRMTSKASVAVRRRLEKQFKKHQNRRGEWDEAIGEIMVNHQLAEVLVADWENIRDRDGSEIPCTKENVLTLMTRLPTFRDVLVMMSAEMDNYRIETVEAASKN